MQEIQARHSASPSEDIHDGTPCFLQRFGYLSVYDLTKKGTLAVAAPPFLS
jgi:hypothetical protein